jgi:hypothetical protein
MWLLERGFREVTSLMGGFEGWRVIYPESTSAG